MVTKLQGDIPNEKFKITDRVPSSPNLISEKAMGAIRKCSEVFSVDEYGEVLTNNGEIFYVLASVYLRRATKYYTKEILLLLSGAVLSAAVSRVLNHYW